MRCSFAFALLLLLPALTLIACGGEDEPSVELSEDPANSGNPDLLGYWALIEENGRTPENDRQVRYQFTAQGDFIRYTGGVVEQARYTFASENEITIDGPTGTHFYTYAIDGNRLTMTEPGDGGRNLTLSKLADQNLEDVPAPSTSVPEEDSVPGDSMDAGMIDAETAPADSM